MIDVEAESITGLFEQVVVAGEVIETTGLVFTSTEIEQEIDVIPPSNTTTW